MLSQLRKTRLGFTLVELAIVLAVAGLLFGGLWRLLSGGNQQLRDQSAASSQVTLINSVKAFLATSQGQAFLVQNEHCTTAGPITGAPALVGSQKYCSTTPFQLDLPTDATNAAGTSTCQSDYAFDGANNTASYFCLYLPGGFSALTTNSYNQTYKIMVLRDGTAAGSVPSTYSFMILTIGGDPIPDTSGGRIAASIGGDGGFIYQNSTGICPSSAPVTTDACGAYAAWYLDPRNTYGFLNTDDKGGTTSGGQIATRTYVSPGQTATFPWLARNTISGDGSFNFNTMLTGMYMGVTSGGQVAAINMQGGDINMNSTTIGNPPTFGTAGGGHLNMASGQINFGANAGSLNMAGSPINTNGGNVNMAGGTIDLAGGTLIDSTGGNGAILLTQATQHTGNSVITASMPCTIQSYNSGTSQWVDGPNGTGAQCGFAITTTSITVTGLLQALGFYAGTFVYNGSDIRLKRDIHPLTDALENVMRLKPVNFTYKSTGQESMGIIAQDLEKVYPQLIAVGDKGMKHVAYDGLIAPLIGSVQELKKENDELSAEVKGLAERQGQLEAQLKNSKNK